MINSIKEATYTTSEVASPPIEATKTQSISYLIYYIFGAIEILLGFRLVMKFLGASTASTFVSAIYGFSNLLIMPFEGIFSRSVNQGLENASVFEPATFIGMLVYGVLAWGLVKLALVVSREKQE